MLRSSAERQQAELNYVRDLNLNAVRLEGKIENDHFFDLADQMGILVLPGWCCCDQWENWPAWDQENERIAGDSLRDQLRRLERHPSVIAWLYGSDFAPPPRIENLYLQIMKEVDWPNPSISSAGARNTTVGPSGVKMTGPYEYVAPIFWYIDTRHGGAFGFNTETSPGPAIPPIESLRRMLPADHLWPIDSVWEYHAGGMSHTLDVFTHALDKRYGESKSVEDLRRQNTQLTLTIGLVRGAMHVASRKFIELWLQFGVKLFDVFDIDVVGKPPRAGRRIGILHQADAAFLALKIGVRAEMDVFGETEHARRTRSPCRYPARG